MTLFFSSGRSTWTLNPPISLIGRFEPATSHSKTHPGMRFHLEPANLVLSVWGRLYQPVTISHGCHHGLQLEAPTSYLLQFYCISDSSNFFSSSVHVCACVCVSHWLTDLLSSIFFVFHNWFYSEYFPPFSQLLLWFLLFDSLSLLRKRDILGTFHLWLLQAGMERLTLHNIFRNDWKQTSDKKGCQWRHTIIINQLEDVVLQTSSFAQSMCVQSQ